jgi:hypothetical protein
MLVGYSQEGLPIEYDADSVEVIYKDNRVSLFKIKSALESGCDEYQLTKNLTYSKGMGFTNFGCLTLSNVETQNLFNKLWKLSRMYSTTGN